MEDCRKNQTTAYQDVASRLGFHLEDLKVRAMRSIFEDSGMRSNDLRVERIGTLLGILIQTRTPQSVGYAPYFCSPGASLSDWMILLRERANLMAEYDPTKLRDSTRWMDLSASVILRDLQLEEERNK